MNKHATRRRIQLNLTRTTLKPLANDQLHDVPGGRKIESYPLCNTTDPSVRQEAQCNYTRPHCLLGG